MVRILLYLLGPSSKQKVNVSVASSSKNSVAKASHQRLSLSCRIRHENVYQSNQVDMDKNRNFQKYHSDNFGPLLQPFVQFINSVIWLVKVGTWMPSAEKRRARMIQSIWSTHRSRWSSHWPTYRSPRTTHWPAHGSRSTHRSHSRIGSAWSGSAHGRTAHVGWMGPTSHTAGPTHGPCHHTGHDWTVSGMSDKVRTRTRPPVAEWGVGTTRKSGMSLRMGTRGSSRTGTDTPWTWIGRAKRRWCTRWSVEMRTWTLRSMWVFKNKSFQQQLIYKLSTRWSCLRVVAWSR